jgi:(2Fe-2S) ferredoxin
VFRATLEEYHARENVEIMWQSCFGRCTQGPNVLVREMIDPTAMRNAPPTLGTGFATPPGPRGTTALYNHVDPSRVDRIVAEHVVEGRVARELVERPGEASVRYSEPVAPRTKDTEQ